MDTLYEILEQQLKCEPNFVEDDGKLKKWVVVDRARNFDEELIGLLLDNKALKDKFFVSIKGTLVFNQSLFIQFLECKNYFNDSYTKFKNKVGLTIGGKHLKQRNEVALVWPFKDCILEGGQSSEEDKREEIFFNEILAQDEITQLLEPKVLTNAKVFDQDGEHDFNGFTRDATLNEKRDLPQDTITDNLIIKGNNLLALYSLEKEFAGKVKLIYIDPPYNPKSNNNTFAYNNSFNHSTWLTFMKNRLESAKKLLSDDGVIEIAIDENEQAYLGVLLDEVFKGYEKHCITIEHNPRGVLGNNFYYNHEFVYFVFKQGLKAISQIKREPTIKEELRDHGGESLRTDAKNCFYPIVVKDDKIIGFGDVSPDYFNPTSKNITHADGTIEVYPIDGENVERKWIFARQSIEKIKDNLFVKTKSNGEKDIFRIKDKKSPRTVWYGKRYDASTFGSKVVNKMVGGGKFSFPKSLYAVYDCLYSVVSEDKNAIVLDYHAGSGTTAHALLELNKEDSGNRQFILCEQMDYAETVTTKRVQKVIEQNESGSFTYLELKKYNQFFIEKIEKAKDSKTLLKIWEQMKEKSFLNYNVDIKKQEEHIEEFKDLSLQGQKQHLCELLDKNQLYVNRSSLNDKDFACTDEEKRISNDFYQTQR